MHTGANHKLILLGGFMVPPNLDLLSRRSEETCLVSDVVPLDPGSLAVSVVVVGTSTSAHVVPTFS